MAERKPLRLTTEPPPDPGSVTDGLPTERRRPAMASILLAVGLATLDTAIANTALPTIAASLGISASDSVWIVNVYQFALVATLLPLAALGEIIGQRRIHIIGVSLFTFASLLCALAPSLPVLIAARVLQGLGGSAAMAANVALIRFIYPSRLLGTGVGLNAFVVGVGFAIGPTIASTILYVSSWPWLFAVNVPLGLVALFLAFKALPETTRSGHTFDVPAAALTGATFAALVIGLGEAAHGGSRPAFVIPLVLAVCCGALLLRRQTGHPAPMFPADLLKLPIFGLSAATAFCSFAAQGLAFVSLPFLMQHVLGRTPVETGFLMTPWSVVVAIMAPIAGRLSDRYPPGLLGGVGLAMMSGGLALLALLPTMPSDGDIVWRMALCGAGFGFFQAPNIRSFMTSAPPNRSGGASGMAALMRLFGQTTGAALVAACFALADVRGPTLALSLGTVFAGLASIVSFLRLFR